MSFFKQFMEVVFDSPPRRRSLLPFFYLLPGLIEPPRNRFRDEIIPVVLKCLTLKRPLDCDRREFLSYAEAFAALVKLEFVSIPGAVTTIITLLKKPDTRSAAITMLGKTVEICPNLLQERCEQTKLQELRICLQSVKDDLFQYDINYIEENMHWGNTSTTVLDPNGYQPLLSNLNAFAPPLKPGLSVPTVATAPITPFPLLNMTSFLNSSSASTVPSNAISSSLTNASSVSIVSDVTSIPSNTPVQKEPTGTCGVLKIVNSFSGHSSTIFAMTYDEVRDQIISASKDGGVIAWSMDGKQKESFILPKYYACSMDINPRTRSLFICGVARNLGNNPPAIIWYTQNEKGAWSIRGILEQEGEKLVSCVNVFPSQEGRNMFIVGKSTKITDRGHSVQLYDASSAAAFNTLQPLFTCSEHENIITSLAVHPNSDTVFFSSSRDLTIKVWDIRQSKSVGTLGSIAANNKIVAHDGMITCLNSMDTYLVSGSLDKNVALWDLRVLGPMRNVEPLFRYLVNDSGILKVAFGPGSKNLAVSTTKGLCLLDLHTGVSQPAISSPNFGRYHDLKWNRKRNILHAAGDDMSVDSYELEK